MRGVSIFQSYKKFLLLGYFIIFLLRIVEISSISVHFGLESNIILSEVIGFFFDFIFINAILLLLFPAYYLLYRISCKAANIIFLIFFILFSILHLLILQYFTYQLSPLGTSIYQYSFREIAYTVTTTSINYFKIGITLSIIFLCILFAYKFLSRKRFSHKSGKMLFIIPLISIPLFVIQIFTMERTNDFVKNKSLYFYKNSISYFVNNNIPATKFTTQDALDYQSAFPNHQHISQEYPLLHKLETSDSLSTFFHKFDSVPNIVLLIIEGLNDDFIHNYRGIQLMPFLNSLIGNSLYWDNCLSVGERSFAVVPSTLGGLPYGEKGFTLLGKYPIHLSLIPVLKNNGYHTTFFYGQGKWFHQKDRFFDYNYIDLIVDNEKYPEKYEKIIVDDFFWGYNDKALLNNSLDVIDTLPKQPRFDIYFTGTSHSPYKISDENEYDERFKEMVSTLSIDNIPFFNTHKEYIKSLFFVDDALKDFFEKYKEKENYENTLFIVTGDHPMTELPRMNSLKRYHVPLCFYSEKIKTPRIFHNTVSHLDIFETVISFLKNNGMKIPAHSSSLGNNLFYAPKEKQILFMNDNRDIIDYYNGEYFLSGSTLYQVDENFQLSVAKNKIIKKKLQEELNIFRKMNDYVCLNNKILPDSIYFEELNIPLIFSLKNLHKTEINEEYYNIVSDLEITNTNITYTISFDYSKPKGEVSLVYTLSTENDSLLFWQNTGILKDHKSFQHHIDITVQDVADSTLIFNSYLWNQNKKKLIIENLNAVIH